MGCLGGRLWVTDECSDFDEDDSTRFMSLGLFASPAAFTALTDLDGFDALGRALGPSGPFGLRVLVVFEDCLLFLR